MSEVDVGQELAHVQLRASLGLLNVRREELQQRT